MADENKEKIDYQMYLDYLDSVDNGKPEVAETKHIVESDMEKDDYLRKYGMEKKHKAKEAKLEKKARKAKKHDMQDISSGREDIPEPKHRKKSKAPLIITLLVILGIIAAGAAVPKVMGYGWFGVSYFLTNHIKKNMGETGKKSLGVMKNLKSDDAATHGTAFQEPSADECWAINEWIDKWSDLEGKPMYNNKVLNVLLLGCDDPNGDEHNRTRSDSMVIVSIDTINKKIKMTSILRDTYTKFDVPKTDYQEAYRTHSKLNESCYYGGPDLVEKTIEDMYKVRIDGWVQTTFSNFQHLIDAMDGIDVEVTESENNYLLRTAPVSWPESHVGFSHLNGAEALVYSRIRKLDSDQNRTERQRKVLSAIINKAGSLSTTELMSAVNKYMPFLKTNFAAEEITQLGFMAASGGWSGFEISQYTAPDPEGYEYLWGGIPGNIINAWVWIVDIPHTATEIQKYIYGGTEGFEQSKAVLAGYRHSVSEFVG